MLDSLRSARKLPEEQDFRLWKQQLYEAYRAIEPKEHMWHLPDGRTLRVVTTPNPAGGVTYLYDDVTERLDLHRRYDALIKVLVISRDELKAVVDKRPKGFGDEPGKYHSDAIFLMAIDRDEAFAVFKPREGVDKVWPGEAMVYSQRLSAERTKSRLGSIVASPLYKSMTIRSWQTVLKLMEMMDAD